MVKRRSAGSVSTCCSVKLHDLNGVENKARSCRTWAHEVELGECECAEAAAVWKSLFDLVASALAQARD